MKTDRRPDLELRDLARQENAGLSSDARARVLAKLQEDGPRVVRRARLQRQISQVGSVVAGVAIAVGSAWLIRDMDGRSLDSDRVASARPCASRPTPMAQFQTAEDGELLLDLGARAFVRADPGSKVHVAENEACRLVLSLEQGRVDVHARDLGAGELQVLTAEGRIEVRGTIFSVARQEGDLTVDVAEGVVEFATMDEPKASVRRGQRLKRVRKIAERVGLEEAEELRLLLAVRAIDPDDTEETEDTLASAQDVDELEENAEIREQKPKRSLRKKRRWKRRPIHRETPSIRAAPVESAPNESNRVEVAPVEPAPVEVAMPPELPVETLDSLLADAERFKRAGDLNGARRALRRAGEMAGPDARAAWISLARLELQLGNTADVRRSVAEYQRRGGGALEPEGAWILVRAEERAGRIEEARAEAASLLRRWPSTPQAEEARRWIQRADAGSSP